MNSSLDIRTNKSIKFSPYDLKSKATKYKRWTPKMDLYFVKLLSDVVHSYPKDGEPQVTKKAWAYICSRLREANPETVYSTYTKYSCLQHLYHVIHTRYKLWYKLMLHSNAANQSSNYSFKWNPNIGSFQVIVTLNSQIITDEGILKSIIYGESLPLPNLDEFHKGNIVVNDFFLSPNYLYMSDYHNEILPMLMTMDTMYVEGLENVYSQIPKFDYDGFNKLYQIQLKVVKSKKEPRSVSEFSDKSLDLSLNYDQYPSEDTEVPSTHMERPDISSQITNQLGSLMSTAYNPTLMNQSAQKKLLQSPSRQANRQHQQQQQQHQHLQQQLQHDLHQQHQQHLQNQHNQHNRVQHRVDHLTQLSSASNDLLRVEHNQVHHHQVPSSGPLPHNVLHQESTRPSHSSNITELPIEPNMKRSRMLLNDFEGDLSNTVMAEFGSNQQDSAAENQHAYQKDRPWFNKLMSLHESQLISINEFFTVIEGVRDSKFPAPLLNILDPGDQSTLPKYSDHEIAKRTKLYIVPMCESFKN